MPGAIKHLWSIDEAGRVRLTPNALQAAAWESKRRFTFMIAGTQAGKTSFGPWWLFREIYQQPDAQLNEGGDWVVVTSTFDLFKLKMLPEIQGVFEDVLKMGRYWAGDRILELIDPRTQKFWASRSNDRMWGRIILRSAHAEGGLEASTARGALL